MLAHFPEVEKAVLYGSRAKGTQRPGSDIDLTLCGSGLEPAHLARIDEEMDDLLLPYKIDLSDIVREGGELPPEMRERRLVEFRRGTTADGAGEQGLAGCQHRGLRGRE